MATLLIANRGEIACRIARTARALGWRVAAIHSDADAGAPHVRAADLALRIGPGPVGESYLDPARVLAAAKACAADAIHPGYGFLSENAAFARSVLDAGLVFVGPPPDAIEAMGDKAAARRRMIAAGVPCVPGYDGADQSDPRLTDEALRIGFPLMVKAAAGGGGRGMRRVASPDDLAQALTEARAEAARAFGSDALILERAIEGARHVEVQVLADGHGTILHLGERDCSLQRRHQKVIEEAPSPAVDEGLRARMGEAAVAAARSVGYVGAGTVEFLLEASGAFHFLEMNTRLQVEHPVTEAVTGLDLVEWQLRIAQGEALNLAQDDIGMTGHAIEARLYAEDPAAGFRPCTGAVALWRPSPLARVDAGIETGTVVSPFYDPMLAKIIAAGPTREVARARLIAALRDTVILGVGTNKSWLVHLLQDPVFVDGKATTDAIDRGRIAAPDAGPDTGAVAAVLLHRIGRDTALSAGANVTTSLLDWSSAGPRPSIIRLDREGSARIMRVTALGGDRFRVTEGGTDTDIHLTDGGIVQDGRPARLTWTQVPDGVVFDLDGTSHLHRLHVPAASGGRARGDILAPMPGLVAALHVAEGDRVTAGQIIGFLEAMKMQHPLRAPRDGVVQVLGVATGDQIAQGATIARIAGDEDD